MLPGEPSLREVNELKEKQISLSIRENDSLQCYHSFTSGIKLQTRISYSSQWDMHPRVVRKTMSFVYGIILIVEFKSDVIIILISNDFFKFK